MRVAVVTTTINVPVLLADYLAQFAEHDNDGVLFVVVGDKRSPPETAGWLGAQDWGKHSHRYLDVATQQQWLRRFPALAGLLPWNSIQRRNLGYLVAAEQGAETIISIDDDNHVTGDDFLAGHRIVGTTATVPCVRAASGWANICSLLRTDSHTVLPRGFPVSERAGAAGLADWTTTPGTGRVVVNAGLWLGEPDVDAVSRIVTPVTVLGLDERAEVPVAMAPGTWCPFNSQNTAFAADLLAAMYLVVMGAPYRGVPVGRYDDIWMSYFVRCLADHLGDLVTYGRPLVRQDRNPHAVLGDLWGELPGMVLTESLVRVLGDVTLTGRGYAECYRELQEELLREFRTPRHDRADREFWTGVVDGMSVWTDVCEEVVSR